MDDVEVTVLMSVYNANLKELNEAVTSILNQTYKNFEFLIINDGTKNGEKQLIESYNDNRIRIIDNEKNMGLEKSLNKGIENAKGKYIIRMDADDISHIDRIDKQLKFIKEHSQYSIISSRVNYFDESGIYGTSSRRGEINKKNILYGNPFAHPAMIINKSDIQKIGGYPLYRRCEDYAMVINMYANGMSGCIMEDILLDYRLDKNNYKKKKTKDRKIECKMKWNELKKLNITFYQRVIYSTKPFIAGIIPKSVMNIYHRKVFKNEKN
jgi:yveO